jgi:hypothetical protein
VQNGTLQPRRESGKSFPSKAHSKPGQQLLEALTADVGLEEEPAKASDAKGNDALVSASSRRGRGGSARVRRGGGVHARGGGGGGGGGGAARLRRRKVVHEMKAESSLEHCTSMPFDEDESHEFKSLLHVENVPRRVAMVAVKYVNAFLNSEGGSIYFGVSDDGIVTGVRLPRELRDSLRLLLDAKISDSMVPPVDPSLVRIQFIPISEPSAATIASIREQQVRSGPNVLVEARIARKVGATGLSMAPSVLMPSAAASAASAAAGSTAANGDLFVVRVKVRAGRSRSPVYFLRFHSEYVAFMRRSGSTSVMPFSIVNERLRLGRLHPDGSPPDQSYYVGKSGFINEVRSFVMNNRDDRKLAVFVYGIPGVGKSAFVQKLISELRPNYLDSPIYIALSTKRDPDESDIEIAKIGAIRFSQPDVSLPIERAGTARDGEEHRLWQAELQALYERCFSDKSTILLIENVHDVEQVRSLIPVSATRLLVLVTSHFALNPEFADMHSMICKLTPLSERSAVKLLRYYSPTLADAEANDLARLAGYLPLTLRILGAMLKHDKSMSAQSLIERLKEPDYHQELMERTFRIAGEEISADPKTIVGLRACSLFPSSFDLLAFAAVLDESYEAAEGLMNTILFSNFIERVGADRYLQNEAVRTYWRTEAEREVPAELAEMKDRFFQYFLVVLLEFRDVFSVEYCVRVDGGQQDTWLRFWNDRDNFEASLGYCDAGSRPQLAYVYSTVLEEILSVWRSPACGPWRDALSQAKPASLPESHSIDDFHEEYDFGSMADAISNYNEDRLLLDDEDED